MKRLKPRQVVEILVATAVVSAAEYIVGQDPLFSQLWGTPYTLLPAVFAAYYGGPGLVVSAISLIPVGLAHVVSGAGADLLRLSVGLLAGGVLSGLSLGMRSLLTEQRETLLARIRDYVGRTRRLERENATLEELCRELEGRITRERKSLTYLLTKLERIESSTLAGAWEEILDAVHTFTGATQASVWRYDRGGDVLTLESSLGWGAGSGPSPTSLEASKGVLGWVARNGTPYSFRMSTQSPLFASWDTRRNILTYPLRSRDEIWGVLNVEAMPFVAYSRQAETFVEVILKIVERPLRVLVEREQLVNEEDLHPETGVAQSSVLFRRLEAELRRLESTGGRFSLVILELSNAEVLRTALGHEVWITLLREFIHMVTYRSGASGPIYHYRSEARLAYLLADRDSDGTALACLELLATLQAQSWRAGDISVQLEVRVGFATSQRGDVSGGALLQKAEDLLRLQETV